jgi:hypothetical protein
VDAVRAGYGDRFGPLYDARPGAEKSKAPFWVLTFWDADRPGAPVVHASWGAPAGEVYLTSVTPGLGISTLVDDAGKALPPDADLPALVRGSSVSIPFGGVIVLPDDDGGFSIPGPTGAPRRVRQLLALTTAENARAAWSGVSEVFLAVRDAGEVADVLRICTVDPEQSRAYRRFGAPGEIRRTRRRLEGLARQIAAGRPDHPDDDLPGLLREQAICRAGLAHHEAALPHVPTRAELDAELAEADEDEDEDERFALVLNELIQDRLDDVAGVLRWDDRMLRRFGVFFRVFFLSHPEARPLLEEVVAGRETLPAPVDRSPEDHRRDLHVCVTECADVLRALAPGRGPADLRAVALAAIANPGDFLEEGEPVLLAATAWPIAALALYKAVLPRSDAEERAFAVACRMALVAGLDFEVSPEDKTPRARLKTMGRKVAGLLVAGWLLGIGHEPLPGAASA